MPHIRATLRGLVDATSYHAVMTELKEMRAADQAARASQIPSATLEHEQIHASRVEVAKRLKRMGLL